jgi:hypothetical protein
MARILTASLVAGLLCAPAGASAQAPDGPSAQLGGQVSMQTGQQHALTFTPRLTLPVSPLTAVDFTADLRPEHGDEFGTRFSSQSYGVHLRQVLWSGGRWKVFGVVGAGGERTTQSSPGRVTDGRFEPVVVGPYEFTDTGLAVHVGPAVQVEVSPRLALRGDLRATLSNDGGLRAMVGGVVPLGRRFAADSSRGNLRAGHDSLSNGIAIGAGTGALTAGAFAAFISTVLCETDDCLAGTTAAVITAGVAGAGIGGVVGAVIDSLIVRKEPGGVSAGVAVRWR